MVEEAANQGEPFMVRDVSCGFLAEGLALEVLRLI